MFDAVHEDLSRQFAAIATRFIPAFGDRSLEVCDLVQEGLILAADICSARQCRDEKHLKSTAIVAFVNHLRDLRRVREKRLCKEDHSRVEHLASSLTDESSAAENLMLRIFISELKDILSRLDADVLEELMNPCKSAAVAVAAKQSKRVVSVSEQHIAKAFGINHYEIRKSISRIQSAVAQEFFLA